MIIRSELAEAAAVLNAAHMMCAAARTAPKTKAIDNIRTLILTDDDIKKVSDHMREIADNQGFMLRDEDYFAYLIGSFIPSFSNASSRSRHVPHSPQLSPFSFGV